MKLSRITRPVALVLILLLGLAACAEPGADDSAQPENDAPGADDDGDAPEPDTDADATGLQTVTIGQPVSSLGYLSLDAARILDTFSEAGLELDTAMISGGDTTLLAALDAGDITFAAPGSSSVIQAISLGEDFQIVYSLMSRMSIDLTVSDAFMERQGVSPDDSLEERLAALDGITIGVSGLGGAQDRIAQWLGEHAELTGEGVSTVNIGPPPAVRAAVEEGQIDGYVLTAPNGQIAEEEGFGQRFIRLGEEIEGLDEYHHTVLVVSKSFAQENPEIITDTVAAVASAAQQAIDDPTALSESLHEQLFTELPYEIIEDAVEGLLSGIEGQGRMTTESMDFTVQFAAETGYPLEEDLDAASGEGDWWTNEFIEDAEAR